MSNLIDLHTHSNASDGSDSPTELVQKAAAAGLTALALTDHDTLGGIEEAAREADRLGITLIPGIEFSSSYEGRDIHIVGLGLHHPTREFLDKLEFFRKKRASRNQEIIHRMRSDGIDISLKAIREAYSDPIITRAHIARYLHDHGIASSISDAFARFIGDQAPYFVSVFKCTPQEAVSLIRRSGGIPVLAHPFQYRFSESELQRLIGLLCEQGLAGVEAWYSTHTSDQTREVLKLCRMYNLAPSGGSDYHGIVKPDIALGNGRGNLQIPLQVYEQLQRQIR